MSGAGAAGRVARQSPNALTETAARSRLAIVGDRSKSLIVVLLLAAAAVALLWTGLSKRPPWPR